MKQKLVMLSMLLCASTLVMAQDITGKWRTFDGKTKQPQSIVQISKSGGGYTGKIVALEKGVSATCETCAKQFKGKPLVGTVILTGLKDAKTNEYEGGNITNPKNGKTYKASAQLLNNGNTLNVRGYIGVSVLGETQTWQRVQ